VRKSGKTDHNLEMTITLVAILIMIAEAFLSAKGAGFQF
jgi:hypothetical protein